MDTNTSGHQHTQHTQHNNNNNNGHTNNNCNNSGKNLNLNNNNENIYNNNGNNGHNGNDYLNCNDSKIIEFIHDLKEAIQNGQFQRHQQQPSFVHYEQSTTTTVQRQSQFPSASNNNNNLSNQTFNYIMNWLKQQQIQIDENKDSKSGNIYTSNEMAYYKTNNPNEKHLIPIDFHQQQTPTSEIQSLKNQLELIENEKEKLYNKYKDLQEENLELKTKLLSLKASSTAATTGYNQTNAATTTTTATAYKNNCFQNLNKNPSNCIQTTTPNLAEKDFEIDRLKRIIDELVKSNEEKEKKVDELTKQVIRFKRIQEIVLSAQTNVNTISKNRNLADLDFDTNSESNSLPSINGSGDELIGANNSKSNSNKSSYSSSNTNSQFKQQAANLNLATQSVTATILSKASTSISNLNNNNNNGTILNSNANHNNVNNANNSVNIASTINQASSLISSCSLSSSLSSSSSSSSSSSILVHNAQSNLTAPLATISELQGYGSITNTNTICNNTNNGNVSNGTSQTKNDHYNTLPSNFQTNSINLSNSHTNGNDNGNSDAQFNQINENNEKNSNEIKKSDFVSETFLNTTSNSVNNNVNSNSNANINKNNRNCSMSTLTSKSCLSSSNNSSNTIVNDDQYLFDNSNIDKLSSSNNKNGFNNNNNSDDNNHDSNGFGIKAKLSNNSSNNIECNYNKEIFKINKNGKKGSISSLNGAESCGYLDSDTKYLSTTSVNRKTSSSSAFISQMPIKKQQQHQQASSQKSSPVHSSSNGGNSINNKSLKNFFGKLIRTSLVNINESNFNLSSGSNNVGSSTTLINNAHTILNGESNTLNIKTSKSKFDADDMGGQIMSSSFKRGGTRATANARLQNNFSLSNSSLILPSKNNSLVMNTINTNQLMDTLSFAKWTSEQVYDWLRKNGFETYFPVNSDGSTINKWIKNGLHLLQASQYEYEKELGIKNPLHRKRLFILLQSLYSNNNSQTNKSSPSSDVGYINYIDHLWVTKWLDDIGLPQYKDAFNEAKIDGYMLQNLSNDDLLALNVTSELHYLSIKRAIHVLRLNNFDPQCLRRRPSGDDQLDKSEVMLWTNHRVMEWLRSIDLSEYAPNLRGSGVHGALMVFEARFNSTLLADILAIPASKTLLRRHLNTLFIDLIGAQTHQLKREAELQSGYQPLNATNKLKHSKRSIGVGSIFSHKRTKSQDSRDLLCAPIMLFAHEKSSTTSTSTTDSAKIFMQNLANYKMAADLKEKCSSLVGHSATLPINTSNLSYCDSSSNQLNGLSNEKDNSFKAKLSILSQENMPTSIV